MAAFIGKSTKIKATVYFKHPSGQKDRFTGPVEYEVEEQEYARLEQAFHAFEEGTGKQQSYSLRLAGNEEITLRLNEVWAILHEPRKLILE
jgi:hypothetical protein